MDHCQSRISFTTFDAADVGAMDVRQVGKALLGECPSEPVPANSPTEGHTLLVLRWHRDECYEMLLDGLQTRSIIAA